MNFGFEKLFQVNFRHSYFNNGTPNCFKVSPTKETNLILLNNSLLFKEKETGFIIAFESHNNSNVRSRDSIMKLDEILKFTVSLNDPFFFNYTEVVAGNLSNSVFHFHNFDDNKSLLHTLDFAESNDLVDKETVASEMFIKPFAIIQIQLSKVNTEEYFIQYKEKSSYWRYLFVSEHLKTISVPAVLNSEVQFSEPSELVLPNGKIAIAFESLEPIPLKQRSSRQFQLVENFDRLTSKGKTVIKHLPHPDVNIISKLSSGGNKEYSEIII
jgi:hypothetical protein